MSYEEDLQEQENTVRRKIEEYSSMLEFAKENKTAQSMIPLLELAIEGQKDRLRACLRSHEFQAMKERTRTQDIIVRATNLSYKVKDRHCKGSYHPDGDHFIFEMEQTKNWFAHDSFPLRIGYLLIPEDSQRKYVITKVDFRAKRPKRAIFTAIPVDSA